MPHEKITAAIANKHHIGEYNVVEIVGGTFLPGLGGDLITSKFEYTLNQGILVTNDSQFIIKLTTSQLNSNLHDNIGKWSEALGGKGAIKGYEHIFKVGFSSVTGMFSNYLKKTQ